MKPVWFVVLILWCECVLNQEWHHFPRIYRPRGEQQPKCARIVAMWAGITRLGALIAAGVTMMQRRTLILRHSAF